MFTYNQESAIKAGGTIRENGAYIGKITDADYKKANSGSLGLELTLETNDGAEFKYLTLWYQKADGAEIKGGSSMISAIMGIVGLNNLTQKQVGIDQQTQAPIFCAPELIGQQIGFLLQKTLYTKNNGEEGYKFEIRLPFDAQTGQTLKEKLNNQQPEMVKRMESTLKDKDERQQNNQSAPAQFGQPAPQGFQQPQQGGFQQQAPSQPQGGRVGNVGFDDFDDDIKF